MGAVLGVVDGLTSWFTPEVRPLIVSILIGSCFKGMLVGLLSGFFARKVKSDHRGHSGRGRTRIVVCLCGSRDAFGQRRTLLFADHDAWFCRLGQSSDS